MRDGYDKVYGDDINWSADLSMIYDGLIILRIFRPTWSSLSDQLIVQESSLNYKFPKIRHLSQSFISGLINSAQGRFTDFPEI